MMIHLIWDVWNFVSAVLHQLRHLLTSAGQYWTPVEERDGLNGQQEERDGLNGQQQPPNNAAIWHGRYSFDHGCLALDLRDTDRATNTTTQLCQRIRASRKLIKGTKEVTIFLVQKHSNAFDSELEAVGNVLRIFPRINRLIISFRYATDKTVSVLLRNAPKEMIRQLDLYGPLSRVPFILSELEQRAWFASLRNFVLRHVTLDECDCRSFGRVLKQIQGGEERFRIEVGRCTFPSLTGFLVAADALFESSPFSFQFNGNKVWIETWNIPSPLGSGSSHGDFYKHFYDRKEEIVRTTGSRSCTGRTISSVTTQTFCFICEPKTFEKEVFCVAAAELLSRYSAFNYLRSTLLRTKMGRFEDWMDALCDGNVRDNVDFLFYLLRMNPSVYFGKDYTPKISNSTMDKGHGGATPKPTGTASHPPEGMVSADADAGTKKCGPAVAAAAPKDAAHSAPSASVPVTQSVASPKERQEETPKAEPASAISWVNARGPSEEFSDGEEWARKRTRLPPHLFDGALFQKIQETVAERTRLTQECHQAIREEASRDGATVGVGPARKIREEDVVGGTDILRRGLYNLFFELAKTIEGGEDAAVFLSQGPFVVLGHQVASSPQKWFLTGSNKDCFFDRMTEERDDPGAGGKKVVEAAGESTMATPSSAPSKNASTVLQASSKKIEESDGNIDIESLLDTAFGRDVPDEKTSEDAVSWYVRLGPEERYNLDCGVDSIIRASLGLAGRRSFDAAVRQKPPENKLGKKQSPTQPPAGSRNNADRNRHPFKQAEATIDSGDFSKKSSTLDSYSVDRDDDSEWQEKVTNTVEEQSVSSESLSLSLEYSGGIESLSSPEGTGKTYPKNLVDACSRVREWAISEDVTPAFLYEQVKQSKAGFQHFSTPERIFANQVKTILRTSPHLTSYSQKVQKQEITEAPSSRKMPFCLPDGCHYRPDCPQHGMWTREDSLKQYLPLDARQFLNRYFCENCYCKKCGISALRCNGGKATSNQWSHQWIEHCMVED